MLFADGFRILLNRDADRILMYQSIHLERTLGEYRSGIKSTKKSTSLGPHGLVARLDDQTIDRVAIPAAVLVSCRDTVGRDEPFESVRVGLADAISAALDKLEEALTGHLAQGGVPLSRDPVRCGDFYMLLPGGSHVLIADGVAVTLRADGLRVTEIRDVEEAFEDLEAERQQLRDGLAPPERRDPHRLTRNMQGHAWARLEFTDAQASAIERAAGDEPVLDWMAKVIAELVTSKSEEISD